MGYGFHAIGGPVVGMSISNRLVLTTSVDDFDTVESNCFVRVRKVCLRLPEGLEHPPVLLITYCDYLVWAESLTVAV